VNPEHLSGALRGDRLVLDRKNLRTVWPAVEPAQVALIDARATRARAPKDEAKRVNGFETTAVRN